MFYEYAVGFFPRSGSNIKKQVVICRLNGINIIAASNHKIKILHTHFVEKPIEELFKRIESIPLIADHEKL